MKLSPIRTHRALSSLIDVTAHDILPLLERVRITKNGWTALCPAHKDRHPSLSIGERQGKILLHCFKGCAYEEIIAALGIPQMPQNLKTPRQIAAVYPYRDEAGQVLYENVRFEPKGFAQRRYDEQGKEVWNLNGIRRVPYRLPELLKLSGNDAFVLTEGEKDADLLVANGLKATSHKNWKPEFNYLLKGFDVIICQDHDKAGVTQVEKVIEMIRRDARAIKIIDCFADDPLPEKHGKDVSDFLNANSFDDFLSLIRQTPSYELAASNKKSGDAGAFSVVSMADVKAMEVIWLWKPFIPLGQFVILEGIEGLGKSWLCSAIACAIASGRKLPFSESEPIEPSNVLLLSAEDSLEYTTKPRLAAMSADLRRIYALEEVFSLDNPVDLIKFESVIIQYEPKLVVIDPMFNYTGGKNLNQESDSRPLAAKLITIAQRYGCTIIGVRHIGKSKGNGDARAAGLGSISWRASARSSLLVGQDAETSEKALCQTKNNLAPEAKFAVGFEIVNGQFLWKSEPSFLTQERMLAQPKNEEARAEQTEAVEFLRESLRDGERPSKELEKEANGLGITKYALTKAKAILGVKSFKKGGNFGGEKGWYFRVENLEDSAEESDLNQKRILQETDSNNTSYRNNLTEEIDSRENRFLQSPATNSSDKS